MYHAVDVQSRVSAPIKIGVILAFIVYGLTQDARVTVIVALCHMILHSLIK